MSVFSNHTKNSGTSRGRDSSYTVRSANHGTAANEDKRERCPNHWFYKVKPGHSCPFCERAAKKKEKAEVRRSRRQ